VDSGHYKLTILNSIEHKSPGTTEAEVNTKNWNRMKGGVGKELLKLDFTPKKQTVEQ
jgi:hypothetical protein